MSCSGLPLLILCLWDLYDKKNTGRCLLGIIIFAISTQLVYIGFAVFLGVGILFVAWVLSYRKKLIRHIVKHKEFLMLRE